MNGEWCYFKSKISKDVCEHIIESASKLPKTDATIGHSENSARLDELRKSKISFIIKHDPNYKAIFNELWQMALVANEDWFNFHITKLDFLQFAEYDSAYEGYYGKHHDVFWLNGDKKYHRKLSCIVQLSDPNNYEGGDFELYADQMPNPNELKEQGTVIFFPSFIEHQAKPVTKGTRYSLAGWFEGPKWR